MKKYELTNETKRIQRGKREFILHRIRAVATGEEGGWVQDEKNLSQLGTAWVADEAAVYGAAQMTGTTSEGFLGPMLPHEKRRLDFS